MASQVGARLLGLLNQVLLARLLLPAAYGVFAQSMAYSSLFAPVADLGVSAILTRHLASRPRSSKVLPAAVGLRLLLGGVAWAIAAGSASWVIVDPTMRLAIVVAGGYWAIASVQQVASAVARARLQTHWEAKATLVERVAAVFFAATGALCAGALGAVLGIAMAGAVSCFLLVRRVGLPAPKGSWRLWKRLLAAGVPLAIADVCHALVIRLDLLAVGLQYGAQSAGWYGSISTLVWAAALLPGSMALALVPAYASSRDAAKALPGWVLARMVTLAVAMAAALSLGSERWVDLLYGHAYQPASEVLAVLGWCLVPASVTAWGNALLLAERRTLQVGAVACGGLLLLGGGLVVGNAHGMVGIATAQLIAQTAMALFLWWMNRRWNDVAHR